MSVQTYTGCCHCGAVAFEVDVDLEAGTLRCNCSICTKTRAWLILVPSERFRLLTGADRLADYRFGAARIRHRFCTVCGVKTHGETVDGSHVAVSVVCLDGLAPERLAALPVRYVDGAHDR
ncbi:MAG: GFA family protein [Thiobacillaceae bacterium]|nr:GFA family protein [Thiobacillaceae bacterium]